MEYCYDPVPLPYLMFLYQTCLINVCTYVFMYSSLTSDFLCWSSHGGASTLSERVDIRLLITDIN